VLLIVADEAGALVSDLLEDVVDERVHDAHGSLGDASLGLEDSLDGEGLGPSSLEGSLIGILRGSAGSVSFAGESFGHFE